MAAMVPFPAAQAQALADALKRHGLVALCGPVGSGKRTLLRQAVTNVSEMPLDSMVTAVNVDQVTKHMQPALTADGGCNDVVWVLLAELVTSPAVAALRRAAERYKQQIVLVSCEKVRGMDKSRVIYHKPLDHQGRFELASL